MSRGFDPPRPGRSGCGLRGLSAPSTSRSLSAGRALRGPEDGALRPGSGRSVRD
jgi:hypothetical protein